MKREALYLLELAEADDYSLGQVLNQVAAHKGLLDDLEQQAEELRGRLAAYRLAASLLEERAAPSPEGTATLKPGAAKRQRTGGG